VDSAALWKTLSRLPQGLDNAGALPTLTTALQLQKGFFLFFRGKRRMTMPGYLLCSLLLLCPPLAMAATPEQELHAEVQKLFPTIFTKCGDDHFSKHTGSTGSSGQPLTY
jgi:hypothetical protein